MSHQSLPVVCAISASDSSGHAGHQCDLRVIQDLGCHGTSVISGITAQNSETLSAVEVTSSALFESQLDSLLSDLSISSIKTGLLLSGEQIDSLIHKLSSSVIPLVVDPVLSTSTEGYISSSHLLGNYQRLLPITQLFTPNIPEAERLLHQSLNNDGDIEKAAKAFRRMGAAAVLIKGGHRDTLNYLYDYFDDGRHRFWLRQSRQESSHTRGTGCALASAAACFIAQGKETLDAVVLASAYISQGIGHGFSIGKGNGLLANRGWPEDILDYPQLATSRARFDRYEFPRCEQQHLGLYPIVDSIEWLRKLLELGVNTIQLRVKDIAEASLEKIVSEAVVLGRKFNARLFINDHWQLAIKHGAYGVHLGQEDLDFASLDAIAEAGLRLGLSSHSEYEWLRAASVKPSYIAMGAVFASSSKDVKTIGLEYLKRWTSTLNQAFATVAIGGITENNIDDVMACEVGSCAVISAITKSDDYQAATQRLLMKFPLS